MRRETAESSDVLIVCGQGTYEKGNYYTEYPDRDVYLNHAASVKEIVGRFNYTHVVCSGGPTQSATGPLSEARSFEAMWDDTNSWPVARASVFWDEAALDSGENVYLGLMQARIGLGAVPIRRIGVFAAWKFKKVRFNCLARETGIIDRFYFHGLAPTEEADAGERALQGENAQVKRIVEANDHLLLGDEWEQKRETRYRGTVGYDNRLNHLRKRFPDFFKILDEIRLHDMRLVLRRRLQETFKCTVVIPF